MNWRELGFNYYKTAGNVRCIYRDGHWEEPFFTEDEYIDLHMAAACLHYGLDAFEGLKAFCGEDGRVRIFRVADNARRMQSSAERLCLPVPPVEMFVEACKEVVRRNSEFVPPYGTGASLYLRPMLFATKPCLGVRAVDEAMFVVFCSPVGPYYKDEVRPGRALLDLGCDRSAPLGTGDVKVGGNYASSIKAGDRARQEGYANVIFADSSERRYIEECMAANFFAIKGKSYITPKSTSILPSITNKSLCTLAGEMGLSVEIRRVSIDELAGFDEAGACGTAVTVAPISSITVAGEERTVDYGEKPGPVSMSLLKALQDIQYGRAEDRFGWMTEV